MAYIVGGLLTSNPVVGFPSGTTPEMVQKTWQGSVQNASRRVSTGFLIATSGLIAARFASEGQRGSAWFFGAGIPVVFAALTASAAVHMYRRASVLRVPAGDPSLQTALLGR